MKANWPVLAGVLVTASYIVASVNGCQRAVLEKESN